MTAESETTSSTSSGRTKPRGQNACDECRRRKVRCNFTDTSGNLCTECRRWGADCTYNFVKKKRGPKFKSGVTGSQTEPPEESIHVLVSEILSAPDSYTPPDDSDTVRDILIKFAEYVDRLEKELAKFRLVFSSRAESQQSNEGSSRTRTPEITERADQDQQDTEEINNLADRIEELTLKEERNRHYGMSSTFAFVRSALEVKNDLTGGYQTIVKPIKVAKRQQYWALHSVSYYAEGWSIIKKWQATRITEGKQLPYIFPESDLLQDLIQLYFSKMNPYFPVLHRPTFLKSVSEGLHHQDRHFGGLLLAVCALAARYSSDARVLSESTDLAHSRGWKYFCQVRLIHESFDDTLSLYDFQLYPLAAYYLHTTNVSGTAWYLIGLGIRAAHQKGVHKKPKAASHNPVEDELWKRAFWALIVFDLYGSSTLGRPRATRTDDFDLELPIDCDDEFWENSEVSKMFVQPPEKPSKTAFWIHYLKLMEVVAFALRTIYSIRVPEIWVGLAADEWKQKAVMELDSALTEWVDSIPAHLRWDPHREDEILLYQSVILHATYYWVQFQIHKLFIPRPGETTSVLTFPSLAICANAARSCIHVLEVQHQREPFLSVSTVLGPLFDAAVVLLLNLWRGLHDGARIDPKREIIDVYKCVTMLGMYERRYQAAGRLCDILNALITATRLPAVSDQPYLKRARSADPYDSSRILQRKVDDYRNVNQEPASSQFRQPQPVFVDHLETYGLPCHSQELGEMPVHSSFERPSHLDLPADLNLSDISDYDKAVGSHMFESLDRNQVDAVSSAPALHSEELNIVEHEVPRLWSAGHDLSSSQDEWNLFMTNVDEMLHSISNRGF